ncbi:tautomerase family protein [Salinisphaera aquimarina]|uniref:Tautomerase family protein n=1 Tax=Salinisphaera aquimarina TaxID=2094031 RepID=A0ABV7ENU2_9GAMM
MPLVKIDVLEGRQDSELQALLDAAHEAVVKTFHVPESDRYQIVYTHKLGEMVLRDTGLGFSRTNNAVVITVISKSRSTQMKSDLYAALADNLAERCALDSNDLVVAVIENGEADWSFGRGKAQFLTGEL